jgi:hypothetical protein
MLLGLQIYGHSLYDAVMTYPQAVFLAKWAIWQLGAVNLPREEVWMLDTGYWGLDTGG